MRRFPPPPNQGAGSSSTPQRRSKEAPMQFEWEQPRAYPASPFAAASGSSVSAEPDGEPARKRTHYEAMDIDTPPRPSFPPSATATTNPFNFAEPKPSKVVSPGDIEKLHLDANKFDPKHAFGLEGTGVYVVEELDGKEDESMTLVEEGKENGASGRALSVLNGGDTRRRRPVPGARKERSPERSRRTSRAHLSEEQDDDAGAVINGKKLAGSEYSFQVHHHHAAEGLLAHAPERWLNSNTPHILLGYLQFGSATVLAVSALSIILLFVATLVADIRARLASLTLELRAEILQCAKAYVDNRCDPATRIPAMERRCAGWEECMGREVIVVGKTRVVAETLAEVVNGFVDVISFKTMLFVFLTLGLCIWGSSVAISILPTRPPVVPQQPSPSIGPAHFQNLSYPSYAREHDFQGLSQAVNRASQGLTNSEKHT